MGVAANRVVSTVWNLSPNRLRGDLTWGLPKLQIGWFNGLESQSKQVEGCKSGGSTVWNLSPNRLRGDLTWGLPKLQIGCFNGLESQSKHCKSGGSTVWNLSPNRLRGDLTWGLPKLQIGWFNGLESQSKHCKSGGSTVWNLSPNRLRGDLTWGLPKLQIGWFQRFGISVQTVQTVEADLTWGLPKLQIGWFNGLESQSKQLRGDLTWGLPKLQIGWFNGLESQSKQVEGCKSGGSTVWNLSPNRLRGDLTWGLPKLQIGCFNGLESQSKQVEGDLTWGLPKLQIGWFNGLESQSKQVEGLRGDLTWGLPKLQIGWFNGLESQSKQVEGCKSGGSTVWNLSPNRLRGDLTWGLPKLQIGCFNGLESQSKQLRSDLTWGLPKLQIGWFNGLESQSKQLRSDLTWGLPKLQIGWFNGLESQSKQLRGDLTWGLPKLQIGWFNGLESQSKQMSDRGSGSGGHRRSDRLAKGKAVAYAPESSPDTDDEYDAMEDVRTRLDASLARNLQAELDAEAAGLAPSAARPPPRPGVVIGRSARPSETTRPSPQPGVTTGPSDAPSAAPRRPHTRSTGIPSSRLKRQRTEGIPDSAGTIPEDYVAPGFRYPPQGGIRPRYPVAVEISDTPLLTNLLAHPSSLVRRCQEPPDSAGRGGWSDFCRLLEASRPEYREFLIELGFGPFLSIPYVSVYHPAVWCFIERFFHHTGTFHLSTCEMAVLPVDWSAILGIRFGGRAPPSEPIDGFEAREILGLADRDAIEGSRRPSVRIRHLADVLRRDREEPPTELRYRQWAAYFIFSCFLGNDRSIVPTPIVGMFRDIDTLREYDWGALTYGFYIRGLRRYSRRESISFLGFWQFTVFWAFEHFPTFAPSRLPLASDPDFPLARRWDSSRIERMTARTLLELRMTVDCIRDADIIFQPYSAALSQRPEVFRAVALSRLRLWIRTPRSWELLLGTYIPRAPSDPYIAGVSAYPSLVREDVPYQEWFERVSLGSLMSLHEVEGGRVMGGVAMDSHLIRSSGQIERLESEILRLQLELSVSVDRHTADMDRVQGEMAKVARLAAAVRRLEEQLQGMGITPVTGADPSGLGQPSSSPPRDPVSRDWFFDDPPSS
uniref:Aminotransferase-like plant mobile domain-containing protein n=1 Tax=Fagus sylvatica TaxID=28930 RepID=A0A2N9GU26_FAGSY